MPRTHKKISTQAGVMVLGLATDKALASQAKQIAACDRKRTYPNESRALSACDVRFRLSRTRLRPYPCGICGLWHLTSQGGR